MQLAEIHKPHRNRNLEAPERPPRPEKKKTPKELLFDKAKEATREALVLDEQLLSVLTAQKVLGYESSIRPLAKMIDSMELLRGGELNNQEFVGGGVNPVRKYDVLSLSETESTTVYAKPATSETAVRLIQGRPTEVQRIYQDGAFRELIIKDLDERLQEEGHPEAVIQRVIHRFQERDERFNVLKTQIARHYKITPEEVPLTSENLSMRNNIETGTSGKREYVVSRLDGFLGFDVVPLTVLRPESGKPDYMSVQEGVNGKTLYSDRETLRQIAELGAEHPGAESFMRIACLDYLINSADRHINNIIYDEEAQRFYAIDNGLCLGLSRDVTKEERQEESKIDGYAANNIVSVALDIVQHHPDWTLDETMIEHLTKVKEDILTYLEIRERSLLPTEDAATIKAQGRGVKYLTALFRFLYGNEKIAKQEGLQLAVKLGEIIRNRRPPQLSYGAFDGELRKDMPDSYFKKKKDKNPFEQIAA